jgi:hypothetical protein
MQCLRELKISGNISTHFTLVLLQVREKPIRSDVAQPELFRNLAFRRSKHLHYIAGTTSYLTTEAEAAANA